MPNKELDREFVELEGTIRAVRDQSKREAQSRMLGVDLRRPSPLFLVPAVLSLLLFYRAIYIAHTFTLQMPTIPSPATGRTEPVQGNYNKIVFVTPAEK